MKFDLVELFKYSYYLHISTHKYRKKKQNNYDDESYMMHPKTELIMSI